MDFSPQQKRIILMSNGWEPLWNPNHWIKKEWLTRKNTNIDWTGHSLDQAFEVYIKEYDKKCLKR